LPQKKFSKNGGKRENDCYQVFVGMRLLLFGGEKIGNTLKLFFVRLRSFCRQHSLSNIFLRNFRGFFVSKKINSEDCLSKVSPPT
jgi:hypothetical protein